MSDQASLPGLTPEQLRLAETRDKLIAIARDLQGLDVAGLLNHVRGEIVAGAPGGVLTRDALEKLAMYALDLKRQLRQAGVFSQLAIVSHAERAAAVERYPDGRRRA